MQFFLSENFLPGVISPVSPWYKLLPIVSFLSDSFIKLKSQGRLERIKHSLIHVYCSYFW